MSILKNSSKRSVSYPINLSTKLGFISVNGPRETYFVEALPMLQGTKNPLQLFLLILTNYLRLKLRTIGNIERRVPLSWSGR